MCVYMYLYVYMYVHIYVYINIYLNIHKAKLNKPVIEIYIYKQAINIVLLVKCYA